MGDLHDQLDQIDQILDSLEPAMYESHEDWAVRLLSATYSMNRLLESSSLEVEEGRRRLEKWLKRLFEAVKRSADYFGAKGFSLSVGMPAGVTATVEWTTDRRSGS